MTTPPQPAEANWTAEHDWGSAILDETGKRVAFFSRDEDEKVDAIVDAHNEALAHQASREKGLRKALQQHIADLYGDGRTDWSPSARRLFARKLEMILAIPLTSEEAPHV